MLDGRNAVLNKWSPDFSSSLQPDPTWTRIIVDDFVVCNSIEYTDWATNPVQVHQDEFCGCDETGYNVDITRLGTNVLWTPTPPTESDVKEGRVFSWLHEKGFMVVHSELWNTWRNDYGNIPHSSTLDRTSRAHLAKAWMVEAPDSMRFASVDDIADRLESALLACDSLDVVVAMKAVCSLCWWLESEPCEVVEGELLPASQAEVTVEGLHLDTPGFESWAALAYRGAHYTLAFSSDLVLAPCPV